MEKFVNNLYKILKMKTSPIKKNSLQKNDPTALLELLKLLFNDQIFSIFEKDPDKFPLFSDLCKEIIKVNLYFINNFTFLACNESW